MQCGFTSSTVLGFQICPEMQGSWESTMKLGALLKQQCFGQMFLLKSGSASITVKDGGQSRVAGHIVPGQCFGEISLWIESKRSSTVTSTSYSHLYVLTRVDLDEVLQRFPEMNVCLATNAISSCLRVPSITPALAGISVKTSERLGRRMAFSKCHFENGETIVQAGQQATTAFVIRCALNCFADCA